MIHRNSRFVIIVHLIGLGFGIIALSLESYAINDDVTWMNFIESESIASSSSTNSQDEDFEIIRELNMFRRVNIFETFGTNSDPRLILERNSATEPLAILLLVFCTITSGLLVLQFFKYSSFSPEKSNNTTIIVSYGIEAIALYICAVMILFSAWMYDDIYYYVADHLATHIATMQLTETEKTDTLAMLRYLIYCLYGRDSLSNAMYAYMTKICFCQRSRIKYAAAILAFLSAICFAILFFWKIRTVFKSKIALALAKKSEFSKYNDLETPKPSEIYSSASNASSKENDRRQPKKLKVTAAQQTSNSEIEDHLARNLMKSTNATTKGQQIKKTDRQLSTDFYGIGNTYPLTQNGVPNFEAPFTPRKANTETQTPQESKKLTANEGQQTSVSAAHEGQQTSVHILANEGQQTSVHILAAANEGQQTSATAFENVTLAKAKTDITYDKDSKAPAVAPAGPKNKQKKLYNQGQQTSKKSMEMETTSPQPHFNVVIRGRRNTNVDNAPAPVHYGQSNPPVNTTNMNNTTTTIPYSTDKGTVIILTHTNVKPRPNQQEENK